MAASMSNLNSAGISACVLSAAGDEAREERLRAARRLPFAGAQRHPGGEAPRYGLDREDLIAVRPREAPEHAPAAGVQHVHGADAARRIEPRRIVVKARQDPRRAGERQMAMEAEPARPSRQP